MEKPSRPEPPVARAEDYETECGGRKRRDPYAWLRDPDWRAAMVDPAKLEPSIREYLEAENAYTEAVMEPTRGLREQLFRELKGRIKEDDATVPARDGEYYYYTRFREGGQYPVFARRRGEAGAEEILLDGDAEGRDHAYFQLGGVAHSPDHRLLAYAVDTVGAETHELRVRDLTTGDDLPDRMPGARGDFAWSADGRTLFYTVLDDEHRPRRVFRHRLGSDPADDALVYEEADPGFFVGVDQTESERFILITTHDHTTSEVHVIPAAAPESAPRCLAPRVREEEYEVSDHGERWLILTNAEGARDFRIAEAPLEQPERTQWRDLVPHREGVLIRDMIVFKDWLVRLETEDGLPRIVIRRLADGREHAIAFAEEAYSLGVIPGFEFDTRTLRFTYSSLTTPGQVYDYDMDTGERTLRKSQEIPSGHDPAAYVSRRFFAEAADGERVPVSLLHRADLTPGPDTPLLLHGYGAYGISEPASFSPHRLSLVDRGFVFAIAHVRGGMERGYRWYEQGKLEHKPNTFRDFIACAETLIEQGYTGHGRIAPHGGSAGGMLVGAVLNMRPDLFHAAVADVPFVDVLNTMCDETLPLTPPEWPEWGNPKADERAYETILGYAPYENVAARDYPHILVTAGVSDPRVTYWEPAKWVAKLRAMKTDDNLLLLRTNMSAGHGGASGRFDFLEEIAFRYAFLLFVYDRADS